MKKTLGILLKSLLILVVILWVGLIFVEYFRYQDNEPMLVVLHEEKISYEDGNVYVYWGLGYKAITYERTSLYGKQFGHIFTPVREELPYNSK